MFMIFTIMKDLVCTKLRMLGPPLPLLFPSSLECREVSVIVAHHKVVATSSSMGDHACQLAFAIEDHPVWTWALISIEYLEGVEYGKLVPRR